MTKTKRILYLGLEKPGEYQNAFHYPIIKVIPRSPLDQNISECIKDFAKYTHIIFTSKTAVKILLSWGINLMDKELIAVGTQTAKSLPKLALIAKEETAEGIVSLLKTINLEDSYLFWPHSALSRPIITNFLMQHQIHFKDCILYDTHIQRIEPLPNLAAFDEIVFTSSSCVDAFCTIFGALPRDIRLTAIGPITEAHLKSLLK